MGDWKKGESLPKRMAQEAKKRKWCRKCGAHSHNVSEHDDMVREAVARLPVRAGTEAKDKFNKNFGKVVEKVKARARKTTKLNSDLELSKRQCKRLAKPVLTKRARRLARKQFAAKPHSFQSQYKDGRREGG
jgi:5-methylcytosine-specific restriction endonuclease McrA